MNKGIIAICVHNPLKYTKMAVECLKYYGGVTDYEIVLLVRNEIEGLDVWARENDFACLHNEGDNNSAGALMNQVLNMSETRDIIFLDDSCMVVPGTIARLVEGISENDCIGAVGSMSNVFKHYQWNGEFMGYEEALRGANALDRRTKDVMSVAPYCFMLSGNAVRKIGLFDESLTDVVYVTQDYFLRMILSGWKIKVCESSFVWSFGINDDHNSADERRMEEKWGMHYFNTMYNTYLIDLIEEERNSSFRVLEIGCDCGATLLEIKNRYPNATVYGSEINESAVKVASCIATATVDNIEQCNLKYEQGFFDYIIFGDVLEHLRDPLKVIKYCRGLLSERGCILASIPNLMHITVIEQLLQGRFTYTENGLLDKTHIHFFTYHEMVEMFNAAQYTIECIMLVGGDVGEMYGKLIDNLLELGAAQRFMYETFQYTVRVRK